MRKQSLPTIANLGLNIDLEKLRHATDTLAEKLLMCVQQILGCA